jgi:hypothetical protein
MNNQLWFGCPNCFLAFYSKSEYKRHYEIEHKGQGAKDPSPIETRG